MDDILIFNPPEDTPLGGCYAELKQERKKKEVFKIALINLIAVEELRVLRDEDESFQQTFSQVLEQAKHILKTI